MSLVSAIPGLRMLEDDLRVTISRNIVHYLDEHRLVKEQHPREYFVKRLTCGQRYNNHDLHFVVKMLHNIVEKGYIPKLQHLIMIARRLGPSPHPKQDMLTWLLTKHGDVDYEGEVSLEYWTALQDHQEAAKSWGPGHTRRGAVSRSQVKLHNLLKG